MQKDAQPGSMMDTRQHRRSCYEALLLLALMLCSSLQTDVSAQSYILWPRRQVLDKQLNTMDTV